MKHSINNISKETKNPPKKWTEEVKLKFLDLIERRRRIKHHKIHARLHEGAVVKQQKGRRVPIQLQEPVKREIARLLPEGHLVKEGEIKEDVFLQPTVITVKKGRSVKRALDARKLNRNVIKDKYPMPNLDNLMDITAEQVGREKKQKNTLHNIGFDVRLWPGRTQHRHSETLQLSSNWRRGDGSI